MLRYFFFPSPLLTVPIKIDTQKNTTMNSIQYISNNKNSNNQGTTTGNDKMAIHLLLNAADEVRKNQHQLPPTVMLPKTINEHPPNSQYYFQQSNQNGSIESEAELQAIEFLSQLNNIKLNINNAFQGLKYQPGSHGSNTHNYNNIKEINNLGQELIEICQETRKLINNRVQQRYDHMKYRPPLSPQVTTLNSMTLPYTINNNNHHYSHNNNSSHQHHLLKKKFEHIHSVNIITPRNIKFNPQSTMVTPPTNTPTSFITSNNQSPKMVTKKLSSNHSTTPIIRKNHEMDGKPCTHCLSLEKTPEWRSGPYGNEQKICNACGLFYRKLKQKFGLSDANMIMKYRKVKCATNRRVPQLFDVPQEFVRSNQDAVKEHCHKLEPVTPQGVAMNTQLISPVVTPIIKAPFSQDPPNVNVPHL